MPQSADAVGRIHVKIRTSDVDGCTWVFISGPPKGEYRLVFPTCHTRAIAEALAAEIAAHPDVFPLTDTRRVP